MAWAKSKTLYLSKITRARRAWGVTQAVKCLPSKLESLNSISSIAKVKTK
jgi:hypothetical protein